MEIGNRLFFIAQKVRMPAYQPDPTYGPIVKLKRSGINGQTITVYKFRTMYPFSEFLQEYVYQNNHLDSGGKFKNDPRVTNWGRFMRATWLDELPMLYNWLKGDLQLFGVRPLSRHYLSLYTDELRELRTRVLPGLIPPFYADMPKTIDEIIESEKRYIKAYLKAPVKTQVSYFWKSFVNIVFRGARSK
jgi:lipopolysaccharide/colanic/teichoic acid biosynthesis glycosyltransferase